MVTNVNHTFLMVYIGNAKYSFWSFLLVVGNMVEKAYLIIIIISMHVVQRKTIILQFESLTGLPASTRRMTKCFRCAAEGESHCSSERKGARTVLFCYYKQNAGEKNDTFDFS